MENRLVAAGGARTASLRYDPVGRLFEVGAATPSRRFLWDGDALVAEYTTSGSLAARFVHGTAAGVDDPLVWYGGGENRRLHADHQGSIIAITDGAGAIKWINAYDEWGIPNTPSNTGRFQYTGQLWIGELGMYHYKARIYSPTLGRFLQVDPVGYDDQVNLYAYVGNDPVNMSDPTGERRFGWIVELLQQGERRLRSLSSHRQAVEARRRGENVRVTGGRQAARSVERAAAENPNDVVRHSGHQLRSGERGSSHFQTGGRPGHTLYEGAAVIVGIVGGALELLDRLTNPFDSGGLSECQDLGACDTNGNAIPREQRGSGNSTESREPTRNSNFEMNGDRITGNRARGSRVGCPKGETVC